MSVTNFRLSPDQSEPSRYVEVIADDGDVRVIAQIDRKAIVELIHWETAQRGREAFVKRNMAQFAEVIRRKYRAEDHTMYGAHPDNRKIIITSDDLHGLTWL
jgi:hypothetical protein